jgi:hypothetical protein
MFASKKKYENFCKSISMSRKSKQQTKNKKIKNKKNKKIKK